MPASLSEIVAVEGIEECCALLDQVGGIVAARGYVNGFAAAAEVMEVALLARTPVDKMAVANRAHGGHGPLAINVKRDIEIDAHGRGGILEVGYGNLGHIALWVEYGHRIAKGGRLTNWKKKGTGKEIGFAPAHPFMRVAFDACKEAAMDAFVEGVKRGLKDAPGYTPSAAA